ncbi:MAG: hypothetical protein HZA79_00695 [Sphingobacteriales bacterium]|nr:hypothetical protein [Sphingobacteriales bacterium]
MKKESASYSKIQRSSSLLMILTLLWLTISAPFLLTAQQEHSRQDRTASASLPVNGNEEEAPGPIGNNTEEKSPGVNSFSEEYLHDHPAELHFPALISAFREAGTTGIYVAYHGELLVPPPNRY